MLASACKESYLLPLTLLLCFPGHEQAGFFDVREEDALTKEIGKEFRPATVDEIEGKRHRVRVHLPCAASVMHCRPACYAYCDNCLLFTSPCCTALGILSLVWQFL